MTATLKFFILTVYFTFILLPHIVDASRRWVCIPCYDRAECDADPGNCPWGEVRDACNRRVCAHGPGDRCGNVLNILGQCGEGLMCRDEVCRGCHLQTLICSE